MRRLVVLALCGAALTLGGLQPGSVGASSVAPHAAGAVYGSHIGSAPEAAALGCSDVARGADGPSPLALGHQCGPEFVNVGNYLVGVSCVTTTDCVAVGSSDTALAGEQTLIESWRGGAWSIVPSPNPGDSDILSGVSCTSVDDCVAVGSSFTSGTKQTLVESWNGSSWAVVPSPNLQAWSGFSGVTCLSSTSCVAVGFSSASDYLYEQSQTLTAWWNGANWTIDSSPSPGYGNFLQGVSCTAFTSCVAVGYVQNASGIGSSLTESWNGSSWSVVASPDAGTLQNALTGVSCSAATSCIAVGTSGDVGGPSRPLFESWDGSVWSIVQGATPTGGGSGLEGVSCAGPSACVSVGLAASPANLSQTLVEFSSGGPWTILPSPTPGALGGVLDGVSCATTSRCIAVGTSPNASNKSLTLIESWDGTAWSVVPSPNLSILIRPVVGMAATPAGDGYWLVDSSGNVTTHGAAVNYGSMGGTALNAPITHIVATRDGRGYWLVAADGGTFAFGDAPFLGSMGGRPLNAPVVDIAPTPDGRGYWLVATDGGVFSFGDAVFSGSMGGKHLNQPAVGMAPDDTTGGYWLVATDGGIFSFDAPFLGSTGGIILNQPVVSMASTSDGLGYWFSARDGGVFAYGDAVFSGSMGGKHLNQPVVGMAPDDTTGGYWLVASDGGIFSFNAPFLGAD